MWVQSGKTKLLGPIYIQTHAVFLKGFHFFIHF